MAEPGAGTRSVLENYLADSRQALEAIPVLELERFSDRLWEVYLQGRSLLVFGNGGSAATSTHLAEDLATYAIPIEEEKRLRVLCLNDSAAVITALGNDVGFESVFSEQVQQWGRGGDLVLTLSGSGNSPNLVEGIARAQQLGCETAAMTGFDGGKLRGMVDYPLHVPIAEMQVAQDAHMVMVHMIIACFRAKVRGYVETEQGA